MSGAQLAVVGTALVVAGSGVYLAGASGFALAAVVWIPLLAVGTGRVSGRPVTAWMPLLVDWHARRAAGRTSAVESTRTSPSASMRLPGIAGQLAIATTPGGAAVVLDRRAGSLTAVARVSSAGFLLADVAAQDHRVGAWGRVLGSLSQADDVLRLQVLHRSIPAPPAPQAITSLRAQGLAARVLAELVAQTPADQRETLVAVALRAGRTPGGRPDPQRLAGLDERLATFAGALAGADLSVVQWLDPDAIRRSVRLSYDPDAAVTGAAGDGIAEPPGPMSAREHWGHLETDGAVHAAYWVSEWPRAEVHPGFLQSLLLTPGVRRSVSLTVEPLTPAAALRQIRRAKAEHIADTAQRAKLGQVEDESVRAEQADLARREADLVAGHGDLRFTGLVIVTAARADDLTAAGAALRSSAAQAMCELRRLDGQHGLAHAAGALPLARRLL